MAVPHGSTGYFNLDTSGGSPTDLSSYVKEISVSPEVTMHDTTAMGATAHSRVPGLKDTKFSVTFYNDPALQTHLIGIYGAQTPGVATTFTFVIGPQGSTSGYRKITGECLLESFPIDAKVDDIEMVVAAFVSVGAVSITTF